MSTHTELLEGDYQGAAWYLGCDVAAIKAVASVESGRYGAFLDTGEPVILFERHVFHRETGGLYSELHPKISNRRPGDYGKVSRQHSRLSEAASLNREAALRSASWGLFQIMGFNHRLTGHETLQGFVNAMYRSAADHLRAFIRFIESEGLDGKLRHHQWAAFAARYNGPGYRKNGYDEKLESAFARWS